TTFYQTGPNGLFIFYQVFNLILQSATASFYKMGEEEKAKQILKTIKSDPIGILENYDKYYI
ncbi:hypothetical protein, partial [Lactobacillus johnsonii]|uniref:hypothetical protein n=1 Tax=Lactobacillus johnsonii TaxID=33959 RepID=UPI00197D691E